MATPNSKSSTTTPTRACSSHKIACRWDDAKEKLSMLQVWRLEHFGGNVAIHGGVNQQTSIIVSQPGCSYAVLRIDDWVGFIALNKDGP